MLVVFGAPSASAAASQPISGLFLLGAVAMVMYAAFRAYADLYLRHQRVEKLYAFTRAIAGSVDPTEVSTEAVRQARELLGADAAELVLHAPAGLVVSCDVDDQVSRSSVGKGHTAMIELMRARRGTTYVPSDEHSDVLDEWLRRRGWSSAMVAPVGGDASLGWLAVGAGNERDEFRRVDRLLFEAVANHLSVALENSRLLEELSAEVHKREHRALHHPLTDLVNRLGFTDALDAAMIRAAPEDRVAVLVITLDNFREINEALGHDHGDEVLCEVASRLRDFSQGNWTPARLGGYEFGILVPDARGVGAAARTAELVVHAFEEEPFNVDGLVIELGAHVGVAVHPEHGVSAQQLLRRAEIALRAAQGRHARVSVFLPNDDPHTPHQLVLAHQLRRAIEEEDLAVYVQPEIDLQTGGVPRAEVLVRWVLPDGTLRLPDEFIPVAERTGLIRPLTNYVLARALEHRRQWVAAGYELGISVNVSVRDLVDPAFPEQVAVALTRAVCPARALTLEITETVIMAEPERAAAALRRLAVLGVQVSIDDFGTGYSSLSSVRALAVDEVKIDRSFVSRAADDEQDSTLVRSITELGHGLGLRVVAEGVEDDRTLALLQRLGVDTAQGFGIARPMPAIDLPGWLANHDARAHFSAASDAH